MSHSYQHWKLNTDDQQILWLTLDRADQKVNSLNRDVFTELDQIVDQIKSDNPKGVVITSGKKQGFIAGADINQFLKLETPEEAFDLIRQAQLVLDKLEALPMPTLALINGFSMGGGTELALACRYRIALDDPKVRIGLPEVKLGIHPGWGGTIRLPKLIGVIPAMTMILPGAAYPAKKCKKLGIVDEAVPERELQRAAIHYIIKQPKPHQPGMLAKIMEWSPVRQLIGKQLYKSLKQKHVNKDHYPAPYAVVRNWIRDGANGKDSMINEAKSIADLMVHPTARQLVRVFFLTTKLKSQAKNSDFRAQHVHVIGAGTMGGDIAAWCALKGMTVTLQDQTPDKIAPAIKRAYKLYKKKLRKPRLIQAVMDRLQPDVEGNGVARADLVIEAIFENLEVKQQLFSSLEPKLKKDAILATNTSSIPLEEIGTALKNPKNLVGIHFFNPVAKMPLVEVVAGKTTSKEVVDAAAAFVGQISKHPLIVSSRPGFLVNRVLMPYLMEAMFLHDEGVDIHSIDKAALKFGMPMGPVTLADTVGLDVCLSVAENLVGHFGGEVPKRLQDMVKAGHLGVKSGQGFYRYENGKKVKEDMEREAPAQLTQAQITDRMVLRMVNEAVACLHEGVVSDPELLDAGMIFGTGFAPFRGGPAQYAKDRGVTDVIKRLEEFVEAYGDRFKPFAGWEQLTSAADAKKDEAAANVDA